MTGAETGRRTATRQDYARRIDRVVAHIGAHLDEPLDLARLAEVACFSPYHFHRIYRGLTGETVADTLRRLRLHRAAGELVRGRTEIPLIARRAGYGSVAAFTRAFGQVYGVPPATYRQGRTDAPALATTLEMEGRMHEVVIRDLEPLRVAALRHRGPYMEISTAFGRLAAWAGGHGLIGPGTRWLAVAYDDPGAVPAAELRSEACVTVGPEVAADEDADGGVFIREIPGGRHAVLRFKGPYAELGGAYHWLYREWLPGSGHTPADLPCVEEYLNDCRSLPPEEWLTDICIPLA